MSDAKKFIIRNRNAEILEDNEIFFRKSLEGLKNLPSFLFLLYCLSLRALQIYPRTTCGNMRIISTHSLYSFFI
jgi:hypothetical protein